MRDLVGLLGQRLVVEFPRRVGIEPEVELIFPTELEPRAADRVIAQPRRRMAFRQIGGMGGDPIRDHTGLHVVAIRQAEMLLRRHVAEHRRAEPADHRGADRRGDVVVTGRDIGGQRAKRVERRLAALA